MNNINIYSPALNNFGIVECVGMCIYIEKIIPIFIVAIMSPYYYYYDNLKSLLVLWDISVYIDYNAFKVTLTRDFSWNCGFQLLVLFS